MQNSFIKPNWPVPARIKAFTTTRVGGVSQPPFDQFNLGQYTEDDPKALEINRAILRKNFSLPHEPLWLHQQHKNLVINAVQYHQSIEADGTYTNKPDTVCIIQTADCLPILLCNKKGTEVAALHAGWKSLSSGIIQACVQKFSSPTSEILAWLGPSICQRHYEIDRNVVASITQNFPMAQEKNIFDVIFKASRPNHWLLSLCELARQQLYHLGVTQIFSCNFCTYEDDNRFYSYRRDRITGRVATIIWIEK